MALGQFFVGKRYYDARRDLYLWCNRENGSVSFLAFASAKQVGIQPIGVKQGYASNFDDTLM